MPRPQASSLMKQAQGPLIKRYGKETTSLKDTGKASEFSYRTPFQNLIDHCARGLILVSDKDCSGRAGSALTQSSSRACSTATRIHN